MIPSVIRFSGLDIDPNDILNGRTIKGPIPSSWIRIRFETDHEVSLEAINKWLYANITQKWCSYLVSNIRPSNHRLVVIAFESEIDAVMFKLKGGETAWKNQSFD